MRVRASTVLANFDLVNGDAASGVALTAVTDADGALTPV